MDDILFEIMIKDPKNIEDTIVGALTLNLDPCIESPNTWALNGAAEILIDGDLELENYDEKDPIQPTIGLRIKYKPDGTAYTDVEESQEEPPQPVDFEQLEQLNKLYLDEQIEGRLMVVINHAKGLISPDGSIKTEMNPYAVISLDGWEQGLKTPLSAGRNPVWRLKDHLDFSVKRKNTENVNITVYTDNNTFLGECKIPVGDFLRYPGIWSVNGLKDLLEQDERLHTGTKKETLGKIYVQLKYLKNGWKDSKKSAPINDAQKFQTVIKPKNSNKAPPANNNYDDDDDDF